MMLSVVLSMSSGRLSEVHEADELLLYVADQLCIYALRLAWNDKNELGTRAFFCHARAGGGCRLEEGVKWHAICGGVFIPAIFCGGSVRCAVVRDGRIVAEHIAKPATMKSKATDLLLCAPLAAQDAKGSSARV
jgi:hypothetical protein